MYSLENQIEKIVFGDTYRSYGYIDFDVHKLRVYFLNTTDSDNVDVHYSITEAQLQWFADTLAQAQALGYAEQDPSEDIDGMDVARKTALSINIAFKTAVAEKDIALFSLRNIRYFDIDYLHDKFGKTIRYLGFGVKNGDRLAAFAEPTVLPMNAKFILKMQCLPVSGI